MESKTKKDNEKKTMITRSAFEKQNFACKNVYISKLGVYNDRQCLKNVQIYYFTDSCMVCHCCWNVAKCKAGWQCSQSIKYICNNH